MKRINSIINWCLLFSLPIILLTVNVKTNTISSNIDTKELATNLFSKVKTEEVAAIVNEEKEDNNTEEEVLKIEKKEIKNNYVDSKEQEEKTDVKNENITPVQNEVKSDVISSYTGTMSFYNANCSGCSGITSTGVDVSDGRLFYNDPTYGNVRIIAAGTEIKKWSIVRIKNSSLGDNTLAIVLDRGGSIGLGKKFLVDMLTNNNERKGGIEKSITVEVIRSGK